MSLSVKIFFAIYIKKNKYVFIDDRNYIYNFYNKCINVIYY